jgi:hypothetical protein
MSQEPLRGFEPPRAAIEQSRAERPRTIGYLVGAIVQLALGGFWSYRGLFDGGGNLIGVLGILLLFLGARAVGRYRRSRRQPS